MSLFSALYDLSLYPTERMVLAGWRSALCSRARGAVLELGAGTGLNLSHYPQGLELVVSEPDPDMRERLLQRAAPLSLRVTDWPAEHIGADDRSFDTVVTTLVWCTVSDPLAGLREVFRVLRPGGQLLFVEHVGAHGAGRYLQRGLEPLWRRVAGDCHLTRPTEQTMREAGFTLVERLEARPLAFPPFLWPLVRGVAVRPVAVRPVAVRPVAVRPVAVRPEQ